MSRRVKGEGSWTTQTVKGYTYHKFQIIINGDKKVFYGHTKAEAREKYETYLKAHGRVKRGNITLKEAMSDMLDMKKSQIKQTTYAAYEGEMNFLNKHSIAKRQVAGLTSKDVQKYLDSLTDKKALKGIKEQKLIIKMTMDYCLDLGYITEDIMGKVKTPSAVHVVKPTRQITVLTTEERHKIEEAALSVTPKGYPVFKGNAKYAIIFILHTGLRIGELSALTWEDYNPKTKRIHISKNAPTTKVGDKYVQIITTPKTKNSIRNVPLDKTALEILGILGKKNKTGIMFPSSADTMLNRRNVSRTLDSIVKRAGVNKKPTIHDLRHTFATELLRNGADIKTVSKVLGHASVSITLDLYVHKSDEDIDGIRGLID